MNAKTGMSSKHRSGFSLLELLFVIACVAILLGMLLPGTRNVREAARRTDCSNRLRQLAIAAHNFESAHSRLPFAMGDPLLLEIAKNEDASRLSGAIVLLPFMEQDKVWQQASNPMTLDELYFPAFPTPTNHKYPIWQTQIEQFTCPSSAGGGMLFGEMNYAFCIGDTALNIHSPKHVRGVFACKKGITFDQITDGSSNTLFMAEIGTSIRPAIHAQVAINQSDEILRNPGLCFELISPENSKHFKESVPLKQPGRGGNWADGSATYSLFNTILPPNSPSASIGDEMADGIYSAGGMHVGGINVVRADGSTEFMNENVDAGDSSQPPIQPDQLGGDAPVPSPYGVWGALGTANGEDWDKQYSRPQTQQQSSGEKKSDET